MSAAIELRPNAEQRSLVRRTMAAVNAGASLVASVGATERLRGRSGLHTQTYTTLRERFGLSAQQAVHAIAKARDQLAREPGKAHQFRPDGAIPLDARSLSFKNNTISILTLEGRIELPFCIGAHQYRELLLAASIGGATLCLRRDKRLFLQVSYSTYDADPIPTEQCLGVDRGLINIATSSDGDVFSGAELETRRVRRRNVRSTMQRKAARQSKAGKRPKNIRRRLKSMGRRESRMQRDVNHCISKKLVQRAKGTDRAIALEDLSGIGGRTRFNRTMRRRLGGWAFHQLGLFVQYKAVRAGVPVVQVDPRNTSRECPPCGHIAKNNRPAQAKFQCRRCGHTGHADCVAAVNIRRRGERQLARSREEDRELTLAARISDKPRPSGRGR